MSWLINCFVLVLCLFSGGNTAAYELTQTKEFTFYERDLQPQPLREDLSFSASIDPGWKIETLWSEVDPPEQTRLFGSLTIESPGKMEKIGYKIKLNNDTIIYIYHEYFFYSYAADRAEYYFIKHNLTKKKISHISDSIVSFQAQSKNDSTHAGYIFGRTDNMVHVIGMFKNSENEKYLELLNSFVSTIQFKKSNKLFSHKLRAQDVGAGSGKAWPLYYIDGVFVPVESKDTPPYAYVNYGDRFRFGGLTCGFIVSLNPDKMARLKGSLSEIPSEAADIYVQWIQKGFYEGENKPLHIGTISLKLPENFKAYIYRFKVPNKKVLNGFLEMRFLLVADGEGSLTDGIIMSAAAPVEGMWKKDSDIVITNFSHHTAFYIAVQNYMRSVHKVNIKIADIYFPKIILDTNSPKRVPIFYRNYQ